MILNIFEAFIKLYYKLLNKKILKECKFSGDKVRLRQPLKIVEPRELILGSNIDIDNYCHIRCNGGLKIGNNVLIASNVVITTRTHDTHLTDPVKRFDNTIDYPIVIEDNVWIGAGAIILPNITIGNGAIIGAGAVVTEDVKQNTIVKGIPAR